MNQKSVNVTPAGIAPLANIAVAERAISRALGRGLHQPGLVVMHGPSGYGKSMAAAWITARHRAYYVQADDYWTKKTMLLDMCKALGISLIGGEKKKPLSTVYDMAQAVKAQLEQSGRPLIIDEFDYVVDKNLVEAIRSLYEGSKAAILIICEEALPQKLEAWERFHGRILDWYAAEPASMPDARELARLYCPHVSVADDLLERLVDKTRGSVRRICTNLETIQEESLGMGWETIDLATWGKRPISSGKAPRRG
jgi:predicted kinase